MSDMQMKQEDHHIHNVPTATEDHRGSELSDMVMRGRSILDKDRSDSTKAAFQSGGYDKDENGNYTFKGN